jgi:hypothetical protein
MAADKVEVLHADFASAATAGEDGIGSTPAPGVDLDFIPVTGVLGLSFDAIDFEEIVRGGVEKGGAESQEGGDDERWFHDSIIGFDWFVLDGE